MSIYRVYGLGSKRKRKTLKTKEAIMGERIVSHAMKHWKNDWKLFGSHRFHGARSILYSNFITFLFLFLLDLVCNVVKFLIYNQWRDIFAYLDDTISSISCFSFFFRLFLMCQWIGGWRWLVELFLCTQSPHFLFAEIINFPSY